jgi:2-keto-4-pentenoate hydratase
VPCATMAVMSTSQSEALAHALLGARRDRSPIDATPFGEALRDAEDAYAAQQVVWKGAGGTGAFPRWWKSGGPSREATLTHSPLPDPGVWSSPADASKFHFNFRLVEAEIALRLARDVTPEQAKALTPETAPALIDAMCVSIEIVDTRWQQRAAVPALLKLADLQAHGGIVFGDWVPFAPRDWSAQRCTVRIGDQPVREFRGSQSLGEPTWLLPTWLRHCTRQGATAPAGTVVTTGTWCGMLPAEAGQLVVVQFDGVGEAHVQL